MQYNKVAIGETISFYVAAMDELLRNASVVFATEGGLDLQVCWSCDYHNHDIIRIVMVHYYITLLA